MLNYLRQIKIAKGLKDVDAWIENEIGYRIYSFLEDYLHLFAFVLALLVFLSGWFLSSVNILTAILAAVLAFIAVINLLPMRAEFRKMNKRVDGILSPPFIDSTNEDLDNKRIIEDCLGKENYPLIEMVLTTLNNCNLSEFEIHNLKEKLVACLNGQQCDSAELPAEQIKCMTNRLIKTRLIILIFICNNDMEWLERRLSLYKMVGITNNNNTLGKVVVCTNMAKKKAVEELVKNITDNKAIKNSDLGIFISGNDFECEKLIRHIDRKRYLDNKLREKQAGPC